MTFQPLTFSGITIPVHLNVRLKETSGQIKQKIQAAFTRKISNALKIAAPHIETRIRVLFGDVMFSSSVYRSLSGGVLHGQLGMNDGQERLEEIIETWSNSFAVTTTATSLRVQGVEADYSDVLSMSEALFITPENRFALEWLKWLLTEGTTDMVPDYRFVSGGAGSRTGFGVMRQPGSWQVPLQFSGTQNDSFVTRAIDTMERRTILIMRTEIKKALKIR
jgi:hypothetical protein